MWQNTYSRFMWDDEEMLVFGQCSDCIKKFPDKLGCEPFSESIPAKYKGPVDFEPCPHFNNGIFHI